MKQLKTTIAKLKQDPYHAITVKDIQTSNKLVMNASGAYLIEHYGSVEGFFEDLNKRDILNFEVQDRRKNGTTYKLESTYEIDAVQKNDSPVMKEPVYKAEVQPKHDLFSGSLMGGLNMMDVAHKTMDYSRLQAELAHYKEKFERLEKDHRKLENENLKHEMEGKKSVVNSEMLNSFAPVIAQFLPMLLGKGGAPASGSLGMPDANISPLKMQFIEMAKLSNDEMIEYLIQVANGIANKPEFDEQLAELMTKHNLLEE